jgi:hypothetical protein
MLSLGLFVVLPYEFYLPTEEIYRVETDNKYSSYVKQFLDCVSHCILHIFMIDNFGTSALASKTSGSDRLLTLCCGLFWTTWCHARLQGSRKKRISEHDGIVSEMSWGMIILEASIIIRGTIIHSCFGSSAIFDNILNCSAILIYLFGTFFIVNKNNNNMKKKITSLKTEHLNPFIIITLVHLSLQFMMMVLGNNGANADAGATSVVGMMVMIFINSLFCDLKLKNEEVNGNQAGNSQHDGLTSLRKGLGGKKKKNLKKQIEKDEQFLISSTSTNGLMIFGTLLISSVFYYSHHNFWYFTLQYFLVLINLSDIGKWMGGKSMKEINQLIN